jgi:hypothetical protein
VTNCVEIPFVHAQSSHCESGVASNLFQHHGLTLSEAMAFGIGEGIFFGYLPFIKINALPLTTFRTQGGAILKRVARRTHCRLKWETFRDRERAMDALDRKLDEGIPVGCRTGGYWLPYFPPAFRIHFNLHNLVVYGRRGEDYLISDPVFPEPVTCARKDLIKARFAKGALAPRGTMYYVSAASSQFDAHEAILRAIRGTWRRMLHAPLPLIGIRGIRFLAGRLEKWPRKMGQRRALQCLGQLIRMQEEIGTGGAGFRFMYAAFLQEAGDRLNAPRLHELCEELTAVGDQWREFAVAGARMCKGRASPNGSFSDLASMLRVCATGEEKFFRSLKDFERSSL